MKKPPVRQCLGCREHKPKAELLRIVRLADNDKASPGAVVLDRKGKANGRGAYICDNPACLKRVRKSGAIKRALDVNIPDDVWDTLESAMNNEQ